MSQTFGLLALDLDGTTLTRARTIHPLDRAAVRVLQKRGVHVTIATGRIWSGTRRIARTLGIDGVVACMNGGELRDAATGRVLHGRYLPADVRMRTRALFGSLGLTPYLFASEAVHHDRAGEPYLQYLRTWSDVVSCHEEASLAGRWTRGSDMLAAAASGSPQMVQRAAAALRDEMGETHETLLWPARRVGRWFVKVRDGRDSKGSALTPLAASVGLRPENVVAVGDWLNDLSMFATAGHSFAMGQAPDPVKAAATEVLEADSSRGGGIAEVARRIWGVTDDELVGHAH